MYLATVIDCATEMVLGYAPAEHMRPALVGDAMRMAVRNHRIPLGAVFHSDSGCVLPRYEMSAWRPKMCR